MEAYYNGKVNKECHMEHDETVINVYTSKIFDQILYHADMPKALISVVPM